VIWQKKINAEMADDTKFAHLQPNEANKRCISVKFRFVDMIEILVGLPPIFELPFSKFQNTCPNTA